MPIPCEVSPRGLLFVILPKAALFVSDDLALLRACCSETAVQLDNVTMRERQQTLISELGERSDQLAAVNKELEAFSYSVSHDLRAPLRHIGGFTELLQKSPGPEFDENRRRYLRVISESAVKMGELIDRFAGLLADGPRRNAAYARRSELHRPPGPAGRDRGGAGALGRLGARAAADRPRRSRMLQLVFTNLLSNAFKYSRTRENATIEVGSCDGSSVSTSCT